MSSGLQESHIINSPHPIFSKNKLRLSYLEKKVDEFRIFQSHITNSPHPIFLWKRPFGDTNFFLIFFPRKVHQTTHILSRENLFEKKLMGSGLLNHTPSIVHTQFFCGKRHLPIFSWTSRTGRKSRRSFQ